MASVGAIVKQITETLSDSVSQLVLFVIVLQEQNAEVPPQLPQASSIVGTAAANLVKVARSVADQGYSEYPDIKEDILNASQAVDDAKDQLISAVDFLSKSSDRKAGWAQLVDACKIIAGKTVLLLQIVYGAEVTRLFRAADSTATAFDSLDSSAAKEAPANFAQQVTSAATKAHQVGDFVLKKATETDSPLMKQQMQEVGKSLQDKAQGLIPQVNALLANPQDVALKKKVDSGFSEMKELLKKATEPLESAAQSFPGAPPSFTNNGMGASLTSANKEDVTPSQIIEDAPFDLMSAAKKSPSEANAAMKQVRKANDVVLQQAKQEAQKTASPDRRKELLDAISELENLIPQQEQAFADLAKNPNDKKAQDKLEKLSQRINELTTILGSPEAAQIASAEQKDLNALLEAAKKGNANLVAELSKKIADENARLSDEALATLRTEDDPIKKMQVMSAVEQLEELVPLQLIMATKAASEPTNKDAQQELEQRNKDLQDVLSSFGGPKADLDDHLRAAEQELDKLLAATLKGDKDGAANASKELQKLGGKIGTEAKTVAAKTTDAKQKQDLLNAIKELDPLFSQEVTASQAVLDKPSDAKAQEKLKETSDKLHDLLAKMDPLNLEAVAQKELDQLDKLTEAAKKKDNKALDELSKDLPRTTAQLARIALGQAELAHDPAQEDRIAEAVGELERLIPDQIALAKEVAQNPSNKDLNQKLDQLNDTIGQLVSEIGGSKNAIENEKAALKALHQAAYSGRPETLREAANKLEQINTGLGHQGRRDAKDAEGASKDNILNALKDLEKLIPQEILAAQKVAQNPNDSSAKAQLEELRDEITDKLDQVGAPKDSLVNSTKKQEQELEDLIQAIKNGDNNKVERATKRLPKINSVLISVAKAEASKTDNPARKKEILEASANLEKLLPQELQAARDAAKSPHDKAALSKLEKLTDDLENNLHALAQPSAAATAKEEQLQAKALADAAKKGDAKAVENAAKLLPTINSKLGNEIRNYAASESDPARRKEVLAAMEDLETLIPQQIAAAKELAANPKDKQALDKLEKALHDVNQALKHITGNNAQVEALAKEKELEMDQLVQSAKFADPKAVDELGKLINATGEKLARAAKLNANDEDAARKKEILQAVADLETLIPQEIAAAKAVSQKPNDAKAKAHLDDIIRRVQDSIADITSSESALANTGKKVEDDLDKLLEAAQSNPKDMDTPLDRLTVDAPKLVTQAKNEAARVTDPARKRTILDATEAIERLVPKEVELARQLSKNPNNKDLQERLKDVDAKLKEAIYDITTPPSDLGPAAQEEREQLDKLLEAAKKGDKKEVDEVAKVLPKVHLTMIKNAKAEARDSDSPARKKQLLQAVDMMEVLIPQEIAAAKAVAQKPNDKKELEKLVDLMNQVDDAMNKIEQPDVVAVAKEVEDQLEKLSKTAKSGSPKAVSDAARELIKLKDKLDDHIKAEAARTDDTLRKKQMQDAFDKLEALIPQQILAAKNTLRNPSDKKTHDQLALVQDKEKDCISDIVFAANPTPERQIVGAAHTTEGALSKLGQAAKSGDSPAVLDAIKEIERASRDLLDGSKSAARREDDPKTKKQLEVANNAIDQLLKDLANDAKKAASNPSDTASQMKLKDDIDKLYNGVNDVLAATRAEPIAQAQQLLHDEDKLLSAAHQHDPRSLSEAAKTIASDIPQLAQKARNELSRIEDPAKRKDIVLAIADLETQNQKAVIAATDLAKDPKNKDAEKRLADAIDKSKDIAKEIAFNLKSPNVNDKVYAAEKKKFDQAKTERLKRSDLEEADPTGGVDGNVKSLQDLLASLNTATNDAKKNPNDKAATKKLGELLKKVKDATEKSTADLHATPEEKVAASALRGQIDADKLFSATKSMDAKGVTDSAKAFVASSKQLAEQARLVASHVDHPGRKKHLLNSAADLEQLIPSVINASKEALAKPNDPEAKSNLLNAHNKLRDAHNDLLTAMEPENDLLAMLKRARENLKPITDAAKKGDKTALDKGLMELQQAYERIAGKLRDQAARSEDPQQAKRLNDIVDALDDLLRQLMQEAAKAAANPRDAAAQQRLKDAMERFEQALNAAAEKANAELANEAFNAMNDLNRVVAAHRKGDAAEVAATAKDFVQTAGKLLEHAKAQADKIDDPVRHKQLLESLGELEKLLPQQLTTIKESLQSPSDQGKQAKVSAVVAAEEAALAAIVAAVDPTIDNKLKAAALKEEADILKLAAAAKSGDSKGADQIINDLKKDQANLDQLTKNEIAKTSNPEKREEFKQMGASLDAAVKKLADTSKKAASSPNDKAAHQKLDDDIKDTRDQIQNLINAVSSTPTIEAIKQKDQMDTYLASLGDLNNTENMMQLWEAGQNLSNLLGGLLGQIKGAAEGQRHTAKLSSRAQSALDLNDLLTGLENAANSNAPPPKTMTSEDLDRIFSDLNDKSVQPASATTASVGSSNFSDSLEAVVTNLKKAQTTSDGLTNSDPIMISTNNITTELNHIAIAAKTGSRQELLTSGRSVAAHLVGLDKDVRNIAAQVPDPKLQDRIIRTSEQIRNMSTQLKILAAVKAAGGDRDSDEQLHQLTRSLGLAMEALLRDVSTAKLKYKFKSV